MVGFLLTPSITLRPPHLFALILILGVEVSVGYPQLVSLLLHSGVLGSQ